MHKDAMYILCIDSIVGAIQGQGHRTKNIERGREP